MSVSHSEVLDVKCFLEKQNIKVSSEWVKACATFVKQEHTGLPVSLQSLRNYVYEQWLAADLEEIQVPILPRDLISVQKIVLNGHYVLQVEGIRDVSRPAYSQLKQLEGNTNANENFSATPQVAVPDWEAKPTRMLMLRMTDGCSFIQGMEYKPINFLSPNLPPGIKVLIKGPLECRCGVLLLTADKIKLLGGEVESKLQKFSREALLKETLQIHVNENEIGENENTSSNLQRLQNEGANQMSTAHTNYTYSNQRGPSNSQLTHSIASNNTSQHFNPFNSSRNVRESNTSERNIDQDWESTTDDLNAFENDDDDFTQNLDYDAIDELERENSQRLNEQMTSDDNRGDLWEEDDDVIQNLMAFEENPPEFEMPSETHPSCNLSSSKNTDYHIRTKPFTYLTVVQKDPSCDCVVTLKGFIISVLSKLECTAKKGWSLAVKINDGTATIDADIHDKVLEGIIGVSAIDMMKMQVQAAHNVQKKKEVMQAISKCKTTLKNYNCLMDVKFTPGERPTIVQFFPVGDKEIKQLFDRVSSVINS